MDTNLEVKIKQSDDGTSTQIPEPSTPDEARQCLNELRDENHKFYNDARGRGALGDLQQTFPNYWLYAAELIQNAVDERADTIVFGHHDDGGLTFEHNGKGFTRNQVRALCQKGVSSKGAATVGFMGVGFKAVFRAFECATVSSGIWRFQLNVKSEVGEVFHDRQRHWLGAVLPEWSPDVGKPSEGMTCRFELFDRLEGLRRTEDDIDHILGTDRSLLALLAWRGVKHFAAGKLEWQLTSRSCGTLHGCDIIEVAASGAGGTYAWLLLVAKYVPTNEAVKRFLEHRQLKPSASEREAMYAEAKRERHVVAFCTLDDQHQPRPPERGRLYAVLPTGKSAPIGLNLHADWLLDISRQGLMQLDGNRWHSDILACVPRLYSAYFAWLVGRESTSSSLSRTSYDVFPMDGVPEEELDEWFGSGNFRTVLAYELNDLAFLPAAGAAGELNSFISPRDARILPQRLADSISKEEAASRRLLFGATVIDDRLLSKRARDFLCSCGLLRHLEPSELEALWQDGRVQRWYESKPDHTRNEPLLDLLQALASLDDNQSWLGSSPVCLRTEAGTWTGRRELSRMPRDWSVLAKEPELQEAFRRHMPSAQGLLSFKLDSSGSQSHKDKYWASIHSPPLDEPVRAWWSSLPKVPDADVVSLVVRMSNWVRTAVSNRHLLICKVLADEPSAGLMLVDPKSAFLSDPYTDAWRREFSGSRPVVSPAYLASPGGGTPDEWRAFFETLNSAFGLPLAFIQSDSACAPATISNLLGISWPPVSSSRSNIRLRDFDFSQEVQTALEASPLSAERATALASGLTASAWGLQHWQRKQVVSRKYRARDDEVETLPINSAWVERLRSLAWVRSKTDSCLRSPGQVLDAFDPLRPNSPVADLPAALIPLLRACGIRLGEDIPNAPAIERLQMVGPSSDPKTVATLIREAAVEIGDSDTLRRRFLGILRTAHLVPVPSGHSSPDTASRVPLSRLVMADRPRSLLEGWLVCVESYPNGSAERACIAAASEFLRLEPTASADQAIDFLEWVWRMAPEADRIRRAVPRAYQYVREGMSVSAVADRWLSVRDKALIFTRSRKWIRVSTAEQLFLEDLRDSFLSKKPGLEFATPGHLGDDEGQQKATAHMIGLPLLSTRFQERLREQGRFEVPLLWQTGFGLTLDWLANAMAALSDDDDEEDSTLQPHPINERLVAFTNLSVEVLEAGIVIDSQSVTAAARQGTFCVCGQPADFAKELATAVLTTRGILNGGRRGRVELIADLALRISQLSDPDRVRAWQAHVDEEIPKSSKSDAPSISVAADTLSNEIDGDNQAIDTGAEADKAPITNASNASSSESGSKESSSNPYRDTKVSNTQESHNRETVLDEDCDADVNISTAGIIAGRDIDIPGALSSAQPSQGQTGISSRGSASPRTSRASDPFSPGADWWRMKIGHGDAHDETISNSDGNLRREGRALHDDHRAKEVVKVLEEERLREETKTHATLPDLSVATSDDATGIRYTFSATGQDLFSIKIMPDNNRGYDIESVNRVRGEKRRIEIKSMSATWNGTSTVSLSGPQFDDARSVALSAAPALDYWLYVVDQVHTNRPRVFRIHNPARKADAFYVQAQDWDRDCEIKIVSMPTNEASDSELPVTNTGTTVRRPPDPRAACLIITDPSVHPIIQRCHVGLLPFAKFPLPAETDCSPEAELAWPSRRVVLLIPSQAANAKAFVAAGYIVILLDPDNLDGTWGRLAEAIGATLGTGETTNGSHGTP